MRSSFLFVVGIVASVTSCSKDQAADVDASLMSQLDSKRVVINRHLDAYEFDQALAELTAFDNTVPSKVHFRVRRAIDEEFVRIGEIKRDYEKKKAQGYIMFEGNLVSPDERQRVIQARERIARERAAQLRAEQERQEAESLAQQRRAEAERQEREQRAMREKAKEMYGSYKVAAESVADNLLKVLSAVEVGINFTKYGEMIQELQFTYNKFEMARSDQERTYKSFQHLSQAVGYLKVAHDYWSLKIKYPRGCDECDDKMQEMWQKTKEEYTTAMGFLSEKQ